VDTLLNIKAFLATARSSSFSEAARQLGVAPSVITKRVNQLETHLQTRLLERSTRRVALTETGESYLPKIRNLVDEFDELRAGIVRSTGELDGHLRLMAPTTLSVTYVGKMISAFQRANPRVSVDLVSVDSPLNPSVDGFDVALSVLPTSYEGVVEETLCDYPRVVCASPDYLQRRGVPHHPRELSDHDCLVFLPAGPIWPFQGRRGPLNVNIRPKFAATESFSLLAAAQAGDGITFVPEFIAQDALRSGALVTILNDHAAVQRWVKVLVPEARMSLAKVQALLNWIKTEFTPIPPWGRAHTNGRTKKIAKIRRRK
jgi:DNA-binding transcriptional LysR family regulator